MKPFYKFFINVIIGFLCAFIFMSVGEHYYNYEFSYIQFLFTIMANQINPIYANVSEGEE